MTDDKFFRVAALSLFLLAVLVTDLNADTMTSLQTSSNSRNYITTELQCQRYLCKYGYLSRCNCTNLLVQTLRTKRDTGLEGLQYPSEWDAASYTSPMPSVEDLYTTPAATGACQQHHFEQAYTTFQENYRIDVTSICDRQTMDFMSQSRCGQPDIIDAPENAKRRRRSTLSELLYAKTVSGSDHSSTSMHRVEKRSVFTFSLNDYDGFLSKKRVTWRLMRDHVYPRMSVHSQREVMKHAFRYWSEVSPLCFVMDDHSRNVDIEIGFLEGTHLSCYKRFDGRGGEFAHKYHRDVHFDVDEPYSDVMSSSQSLSLLLVAVHEIGHVLGFNHSSATDSVMNAIYHRRIQGDFELSQEDREAVRRAYGNCSGRFDVVMDYVHYKQNRRVYNSYFFRDDRNWMYENKDQRARRSDPRPMSQTWNGVPSHLDAYLHFFRSDEPNQPSVLDIYFFFKGDRYYQFDSRQDRVVSMGRIREKFQAGAHGSLPSNLDSAYFDIISGNTYFFKGSYVYKYKYSDNSNHSCCDGDRQLITDVFMPRSSADRQAPDGTTYAANIDSIYFSWYTGKLYIFKGDHVWLADEYRLRRPLSAILRVSYYGKWSDHWSYICDTECT